MSFWNGGCCCCGGGGDDSRVVEVQYGSGRGFWREGLRGRRVVGLLDRSEGLC